MDAVYTLFIAGISKLTAIAKNEQTDILKTNNKNNIKEWWSKRRLKYNIGLIIAGIIAFILYVILGVNLIMPYDQDFDITLFTTIFQGIGYFILLLIANLFYNLGYYIDKKFNRNNSQKYRNRLFKLGFYFSISLPFLIPLMIVISYFIEFY